MIKEICEKSKKFLPLKIESIDWNDPTLQLQGKDWGFNTLSCWRILDKGRYVCGSYDEKSNELIVVLKGLLIVSISPQTTDLQIDPAFEFSNGYKLEVFSTSYFEPWSFFIPGGPLYVASPGDPRDI